jgi:hypothetical protein
MSACGDGFEIRPRYEVDGFGRAGTDLEYSGTDLKSVPVHEVDGGRDEYRSGNY